MCSKSTKSLQNYIVVSKYTRLKDVSRELAMHFEEYPVTDVARFTKLFQEAWEGYSKQQVLGAQ